MAALLAMVFVFIVIVTLLLGLAIGIAFLLNWLLPAVGIGMSLLAAVLVVWQLIYIYARIMDRSPGTLDSDEDDERRPIVILDTDLPTFPSRRRRKRS